MAMPQSAFPSELPPRAAGAIIKSRACPTARSCLSFSFSAYSLRTHGDTAQLLRRICMLIILLLRTATSVIGIIFRGSISGKVISSIFAVLGFVFVAWGLAVIGEAKGHRKALGLTVGRWHFDVFLFVMALAHIGILTSVFFTAVGLSGLLWALMWLLIALVAWVASRAPVEEHHGAGNYV